MENIKIEQTAKKNTLESSFDQNHIKEILSKIFSLNETQIKELNEYTGTKYDKEKKYFALSASHEKSVNDLEQLVSKKEIEQNSVSEKQN